MLTYVLCLSSDKLNAIPFLSVVQIYNLFFGIYRTTLKLTFSHL